MCFQKSCLGHTHTHTPTRCQSDQAETDEPRGDVVQKPAGDKKEEKNARLWIYFTLQNGANCK